VREGANAREFHRIISLAYHRFRSHRRGLSVVISTVILSSTLLVIVLSASSLANQLLGGELQNAEFSQGKDVLSSLNKLVERVTSGTGSSGYIRAGFVTTYPRLEATGKTLKVFANSTLLEQLNPVVVKIRGGSDVTGAFQNISGTSTPLAIGISAPMGWLFTNRTEREEVVLDYSRARCVYKGLNQLYNGTGYETFNVIEVTVFNVSSGGFVNFQKTGSFVVQNLALETKQFQFNGNVQVKAQYGSLTSIYGPPVASDGKKHRTLLNFFVINVQVSIVQG
jgi:hypothetical protein